LPGQISWAGKLPVTLTHTSKELRAKRSKGLVTEPQTRRIHGGYKCENWKNMYLKTYIFFHKDSFCTVKKTVTK
jgi:hypothetical protein